MARARTLPPVDPRHLRADIDSAIDPAMDPALAFPA